MRDLIKIDLSVKLTFSFSLLFLLRNSNSTTEAILVQLCEELCHNFVIYNLLLYVRRGDYLVQHVLLR